MDNNFNNKKYQELYNKYKLVYTNNIVNGIENKTPAKIQLEVNQLWKDKIRKDAKESVNMEVFECEMMKLNSLLEKKKKGGIASFFSNKSKVKKSLNNNVNDQTMETEVVPDHSSNREEASKKKKDDQAESFEVKEIRRPAQEKLLKEFGSKEKLLKVVILEFSMKNQLLLFRKESKLLVRRRRTLKES